MSFQIDEFVSLRPYLYHYTAIENLNSIKQSRQLMSALLLSNKKSLSYRPFAERVTHADSEIWLQTQGVLHQKNIDFEAGYDFQKLIDLNSLVFFWPGDHSGPIVRGRNHADSNKWPSTLACLRLLSAEAVVSQTVLFCPYNSGSPRWSCGKKSPRGSKTFLPTLLFERTAGRVVEVVFEGSINLPQSAEVFDDASRTWLPLFVK